MNAICKVCELLDNDITPKPVTYCEMCKEYLCEPCEKDWIRRGLAAIKQKVKQIIN